LLVLAAVAGRRRAEGAWGEKEREEAEGEEKGRGGKREGKGGKRGKGRGEGGKSAEATRWRAPRGACACASAASQTLPGLRSGVERALLLPPASRTHPVKKDWLP